MNVKNKERTPDILGSIMGESIKAEENKAAPVEDSNNYAQSQKYKADEWKERATFNLSSSTLENLDDAWLKLRRKLKGEQRISKTLIVEVALEMALQDFEANNESSELYKQLKQG